MLEKNSNFDYIIVGAGSAGCALAGRLSKDKNNRVLLLEAGPADGGILTRIPVAWMSAKSVKKISWNLKGEPEPYLNNRVMEHDRGKLVGGCSAINGMMYTPGNAGDYDSWRDLGLHGWGYDDVLPYFKRSESNWRGASAEHGDAGPVKVTPIDKHPITYPTFIKTAENLGYKEAPDFNIANCEGFGLPDFTVSDGRRMSTARAYLEPAKKRRNLVVETDALATRVIIEDKKATGVEYLQDGKKIIAQANKEVILSGGVFNSPQLLMLSGVGPADHLKEHAIDPVLNLPGVGGNLQEHPMALSFWAAAQPITYENNLRLDRLAVAAIQWQLFGTGPLTASPMSVQAFIKSNPESKWADLQMQISHVSFGAKPWFPGIIKGAGHMFSTGSILLRPESRGRISLQSSDPQDNPRILFNFFEAEKDLSDLRGMLRFTRNFLNTEPASSLMAAELVPGVNVQSDNELDDYLRSSLVTAAHPTSTCAMGTDENAVLDAELRVRGIDNLRVADASSMPLVVSGNTNAPAIMIAEKAADMILGKPPLQ